MKTDDPSFEKSLPIGTIVNFRKYDHLTKSYVFLDGKIVDRVDIKGQLSVYFIRSDNICYRLYGRKNINVKQTSFFDTNKPFVVSAKVL